MMKASGLVFLCLLSTAASFNFGRFLSSGIKNVQEESSMKYYRSGHEDLEPLQAQWDFNYQAFKKWTEDPESNGKMPPTDFVFNHEGQTVLLGKWVRTQLNGFKQSYHVEDSAHIDSLLNIPVFREWLQESLTSRVMTVETDKKHSHHEFKSDVPARLYSEEKEELEPLSAQWDFNFLAFKAWAEDPANQGTLPARDLTYVHEGQLVLLGNWFSTQQDHFRKGNYQYHAAHIDALLEVPLYREWAENHLLDRHMNDLITEECEKVATAIIEIVEDPANEIKDYSIGNYRKRQSPRAARFQLAAKKSRSSQQQSPARRGPTGRTRNHL
jgi:hypothetical protein